MSNTTKSAHILQQGEPKDFHYEIESYAEAFMAILRHWPRHRSIEDHVTKWVMDRTKNPDQRDFDLNVIRMTLLTEIDPTLRSDWLMVNDQIEREMVKVFADRLQCRTDDIEVRIHAAAANAALRVFSEDLSGTVLWDADPVFISNLFELMASIVRVSTVGALGDPVET